MVGAKLYGPFIHGLNKGGLREIVNTSKLRGTSASNNMSNDSTAVRAYVGSFEYQKKNKRWSGRANIYIEFQTYTPPRCGLPPGYAEWTEESLINSYLKIKILRVVNGEGELVSV